MNYPSFLALCYFLIETIRLTLKHVHTVRYTSEKSNCGPRVINWFHCQPFHENRKKPDPRPFTPLSHSNNMVTLPGQQACLFGMLFSIYEVFFVANICVVGLFTSFMLIKPCQNRQTSASREGHVAGTRRFD